MSNDPAFTEIELAQRWAISIKTLQRWRSENRGPRYIKLVGPAKRPEAAWTLSW